MYKLIFRANVGVGINLMLLEDRNIILKFSVKNLDELKIVKQLCIDPTSIMLNTKHERYGELCKFIILKKITSINVEELFENLYV